MSTNVTEAFSLTDQDASNQNIVASLIDTVQELEGKVADLEDTLEERDEQRRDDIHEIARENHELRKQQEDNREQIEDNARSADIANSRLDAVVESKNEIAEYVGLYEDEPEEREDAKVAAGSIAQTVLERTTVLPESFSTSVNFQRARFIAMDLKKYADKASGGWVLDAAKIRNTLYANEKNPAATHDETVARVRELMAEHGGEDVTIEESGRKKVAVFSESIANRLSNLGKLREQAPSLVCEDEKSVGG